MFLPICFEVNDLELVADDEASISGSSANSLPQQVLVEGVESGFIVMRLMNVFLKLIVVSHDDTYGCMDWDIPIR